MRIVWRGLLVMTMASMVIVAARAAETDVETVSKADVRRQKAVRAKVLKLAKRWAQQNPERWAALVGPDPKFRPGSVPIRFRDRHGEPVDTVLDSLDQIPLGLGYTSLKGRNKKNLVNAYTKAFGTLPATYREGLPDPVAVKRLPLSKVLSATKKLGSRLVRDFDLIRLDLSVTTVILGLAANPIAACENEVGWESVGNDDETSARCLVGDYAALGLMDNVDWVLKDDLTCVKDQRNRGTCAAHAVAANVESHVLIDGGVPENLGEQNIYFWGKVETDWVNRYTDGMSPDGLYDGLDAQDYLIQYESIWNYNQSDSRTNVLNGANQFPNSCAAGYTGELCTDFGFQGTEDLTQIPFTYGRPAYSATDGREVLSWVSLPDLSFAGLPDYQIDLSVILLEAEVPIHLSINVPPAFRNPDANGYVNHVPGEVAGPGSHSILAVGFVANSAVPAGAPLDPDGVGYFVIKNSWGTGYGDCGFGYLSYDFVQRWAYAYRYIEVR